MCVTPNLPERVHDSNQHDRDSRRLNLSSSPLRNDVEEESPTKFVGLGYYGSFRFPTEGTGAARLHVDL
jgi:hypothetical protein